jgi:Tol biopolymer transport system component
MADLRTLVRGQMDRAGSPSYSFDDLRRRSGRRRRNQRFTAGVVAIVVALLGLATLEHAFRGAQRPANQPTLAPSPTGIFADIGGWIVYGDLRQPPGIWAVNPARPGDPEGQIRVSERGGEPVSWSGDGSELLIRSVVRDRERDPAADLDLFVLNADGTETRVTRYRDWITGSLSPDGSQVVYDADGRLYTVDVAGGKPRILLARARRWFPEEGVSHRTWLYNPTFSPDGRQVAYFDGMGDWGHSLRVVNADGSGVRILVAQAEIGHVDDLAWSSDGSHLAFSAAEGGIWIVGVDGSGLTEVVPDGVNPAWSPDGSRLSYQHADLRSGELGTLEIEALDGTLVTEFGYGASGPWNPAPVSGSDDRDPADAGAGIAPYVYVIVAFGLVGILLTRWRARRKSPLDH